MLYNILNQWSFIGKHTKMTAGHCHCWLKLPAQLPEHLRQSKYSTPALTNREYAKFHRFVIKGKFSKKACGLGDDTLDCVTFFSLIIKLEKNKKKL